MPSQFGVSRSPFFLFFPSYWQSWLDFIRGGHTGKYSAVYDDKETSLNYEAIGPGLQPTVQIQNLVKVRRHFCTQLRYYQLRRHF